MNPLSTALALLMLAPSVPASASDPAGESESVISSLPESAWEQSITPLEPSITMVEPGITSLEPTIVPLDNQTSEGEETVISLASDILFEFDKSDVDATAEARIGELVADIPEDASLRVHGHTDGLGEADDNLDLSQNRARTVAEVIADARPDLDLDVEGFGMDQPVEPNEVSGQDNPEGRALNRRVELRYDE